MPGSLPMILQSRGATRILKPSPASCRSLAPVVPTRLVFEYTFDSVTHLARRAVNMGDVLQFPRKLPIIFERLDASVTCIHRLQAASGLPADEMRLEALGARLDMASLREAMHGVLSGAVASPKTSPGIERVWGRLEGLLDQVAICAVCSWEESSHPADSYSMRVQLRATCQSTLTELDRLRALLVPVDHSGPPDDTAIKVP
jgi:hypothetical protein